MKITDVEIRILKQESIRLIGDGSQDTVVVFVHTDEGITGIGEVDSSPYIVKTIIETPASHLTAQGLRDLVIGEDPFDVEKIWYKMYRFSFYLGRRSLVIHAMSGIDIALWDIMGKKTGLPVHKLLGGRFCEKIPAYCSILMPDTEDEIKRIVDTYMPLGYKGIKFGWGGLGESEEKDLRLVRAARRALGDGPYLMIDIAKRWTDLKAAIRLCNAFLEYNTYWVEEPFSPDRLDSYRRLCDSVEVRIAGGEELTTAYEFKELIEKCHIDVVQPDAARCGGITVSKKIIDMAVLNGTQLVTHSFKTGILMSASLHIIAAMPDARFLEYVNQETVLSKRLILNHFTPDSDGYVTIPTAPGLGIEIDMDILNKYSVTL